MSAITFDHATLHIGGRSVLSGVSFNIEAGEFIGLLGPNGSGKTTLMRAVLGLLPPSGGRVEVFGPMADALGLTMRNQRFQLAMMNDTEPSARDLAAFERDLRDRAVKVLIYNSQVSEKLTERLRDIAIKSKVPVVGVTETMPANTSFQDWVLGELDAIDKALSGPSS